MIEKFLKNKTVGVVAPAGRINSQLLVQAAQIWLSWGVKVRIMPHVTGFEKDFFAAPADLRAADFNMAANDDEIDFIICARGGYGCAELHDLIDWELLKKKNKPVVGYSDITALHQMMLKHNAGIPISGAMFLKAPELFKKSLNASSFEVALSNGEQKINLDTDTPYIGKCVVANLTVLASLCGTELLSDFFGKLLILEDLNEPPYKIHRMLNQLAQSGIFNQIKALGCGEFLDCGENPDDYRKIFAAFADKYSLPLYFDLPIGHGDNIFAVNMLNDISIYRTGQTCRTTQSVTAMMSD